MSCEKSDLYFLEMLRFCINEMRNTDSMNDIILKVTPETKERIERLGLYVLPEMIITAVESPFGFEVCTRTWYND